MAACALLVVTVFPGGAVFAEKKSGDESTACTESTGAFPSDETEDESKKKKPPGQKGGKPSPGKIGNKTDDDDCALGALPEDEIDVD